jgi:hypothetical protein
MRGGAGATSEGSGVARSGSVVIGKEMVGLWTGGIVGEAAVVAAGSTGSGGASTMAVKGTGSSLEVSELLKLQAKSRARNREIKTSGRSGRRGENFFMAM